MFNPFNPYFPKLAMTAAEKSAVAEFKVEFELLIERSEPDCHCDVKALVSYGHEKGCHYIAWKARKAQ